MVVDIVLGVISLLGIGLVLLWLIGLPGDHNEEDLAGFVTANWDRIKDRIEND